MQSHLKALLQKRPTSKVCGCWQNPFLCALLERASSPLCWLEAALGSLPCWPLHMAACYIQPFKPRRQGRELTRKINITIICNPTMEVTPHHTCHANYPTTFANAWQITRVQPRLRQELGAGGVAQGHEYMDTGNTGVLLRNKFTPKGLLSWFLKQEKLISVYMWEK